MSIEAMKQALEFIERTSTYLPTTFDSEGLAIHASLQQAIAEAEKQDPLKYTVNVQCARCGSAETYDMTIDSPQRQPLTDEQINEIAYEFFVNYRIPAGSHYDFVRAIEAAHGIKGEA